MEPYQSTYGHLVVNEGWITCRDIRIEGIQQPAHLPLIELKENTAESYIEGLFSGALIINRGANTINIRSGKAIGFTSPGYNLFPNAAFLGISANQVPFWQISDASVTVEALASELKDGYQVLKLTVPAGVLAQLQAQASALPAKMAHQFCNFGAYIKTDVSAIVFTSINAPAGLTVSTAHPGDERWHFIGMSGQIRDDQEAQAKFWLDNSSGSASLVVYLTTPTFTYDLTLPQLEAAPLTSAGGMVQGTLMTGMTSLTAPADHFLVLPRQGNIFELSGTSYISRINHTGSDRFPKGTIITLLFTDAGLSVQNGAYLKLLSGYTSTTYSTLTLVSLGDGTWRELWRNTV
jgi:hypothetical protein